MELIAVCLFLLPIKRQCLKKVASGRGEVQVSAALF